MRWNAWSWYWLLWLMVGFGLPEGVALTRGRSQDTLSYQVWHLEGQGATIWRYMVCAFLVWLFLHMAFELFR